MCQIYSDSVETRFRSQTVHEYLGSQSRQVHIERKHSVKYSTKVHLDELQDATASKLQD